MSRDFNLKDRRPTPETVRASALTGGLPFPPGTVLHESETKDLVPFGYENGDPVPPEFAGRLSALREAALRDVESGQLQGVNVPPFRRPEEIPVEQLPAEGQTELRSMLEDYKKAAPLLQEARKHDMKLSQLPPTVQNAIRAASQRSAAETKRDPPSFLKTPPPAKPHVAPTEPSSPSEPAASAVPTLTVLPTAETKFCPHCYWDLAQPATSEPTHNDLADFVSAILGQKRFIKGYEFLGGNLRVAFRSLTTRDAHLVADQISRDQMEGRIRNLDDMMRLGFAYRLLLSLEQVRVGGKFLEIATAVDDYVANPPAELLKANDSAPLPSLLDAMRAKAPFDTETVWNILVAASRDFQNLVKMMQDRADRPDFWKAIGD